MQPHGSPEAVLARPKSPGQRWLSVGLSTAEDGRQAGVDATERALDSRDAELLVVFCSNPEHDPAAVLSGINAVSGAAPLIGCSTSAVIAAGGPSYRGVVVAALGGTGFSVATSAETGLASGPRAAGAAVACCALEVEERPHQALLLLSDGLARDQEEILAGAYGVVGASVPLVGGTASPFEDVRTTFQLHGDQVLTDAVVGATIASDGPLGIGLGHGWRKVGEPMIVTRSANGRVYTIDDEPAIDAYLRRLGAPPQARTDPVIFDLFSRIRPLGVRRRSGEEVRNVSSTEHLREGWLRSSGEVPEGGLIWLMEGDEGSVLDAADDACRAAIERLGGAPPLGLLAFDCASRGGLLGEERMREEVGRMSRQADDAPLAGFYTWGEIARTRGINGFHNQTLVILAVG